VALVESGLRLYEADRVGGHTKNNVHEPLQAIWVVAKTPLAKNVRRRVESPDQRPNPLTHNSEPIGERLDHAGIIAHPPPQPKASRSGKLVHRVPNNSSVTDRRR
jgi:hypothetical protein